jgi:hypothetical protein
LERSQVYEYLPIVIMFAWMMVSPYLFRDPNYRHVFNMLGMVLAIGSLAVTTEVLKWKASSFTHIYCICRPSRERLNLFVTDLATKAIAPGIYATELTLGEKAKHKTYGEIPKGGRVVFAHWHEWENRMGEFGAGKALFRDQIIDHAKSAQVVVYEAPGAHDTDHLMPVPIFFLANAPGDYHLMGASQLSVSGTEMVNFGETEIRSEKLLFDYNRVLKQNEILRLLNIEYRRQGLSWHQSAVKLEAVNRQVKNELHGVLTSKSDMVKAVVEYLLTLLEAHTNIRDALKEVRPVSWMNRGLATLIVGIMAVGILLMNPGGILEWLSVARNQMFVLMAIVGIAGTYWFINKRR